MFEVAAGPRDDAISLASDELTIIRPPPMPPAPATDEDRVQVCDWISEGNPTCDGVD